MPKKILYLDMDNVLVDFQSGIDKLAPEVHSAYEGHLDDVPGIFALMDPMPGVMEAFKILVDYFDVFILSTAPWENPSTWTDKVLWVKNYLGEPARKRLILTHRKDLNRGDFLVDDREKHGVKDFVGTHLHFGNEQFPDWGRVLSYLVEGRDLSTEVNDSQPADEPEPIQTPTSPTIIPKRPPSKGWTKERLDAHGAAIVAALKTGLEEDGVKQPNRDFVLKLLQSCAQSSNKGGRLDGQPPPPSRSP